MGDGKEKCENPTKFGVSGTLIFALVLARQLVEFLTLDPTSSRVELQVQKVYFLHCHVEPCIVSDFHKIHFANLFFALFLAGTLIGVTGGKLIG